MDKELIEEEMTESEIRKALKNIEKEIKSVKKELNEENPESYCDVCNKVTKDLTAHSKYPFCNICKLPKI